MSATHHEPASTRSKRSPILVTGATGKVGRHVISELLRMGIAVRALTRNPGAANLPEGVELVRGDLSDPATFEASLQGVERVFLLWPLLTAEAAPGVVGALAKHARRIVYLSSFGVRDELEVQADPITSFHAAIERQIERSGLEWTFLRPGGFASNTLWWAPQIRAEGVVRWPFAAAARSLIHERDIAAVAVRALTSDGHQGAKYVLTGPQAVTQAEQVRLIGEAIGRPARFEEIPPEIMRQQLVAFMPPSVVDGILDYHARCVKEPEQVSRTVEEVTGAPAHTFGEWAIDHAADFR
ncbi:NmrA family NAD(P)-binding protein [Hyalangium versicolor]|uniref:NmrA family NAD(P)-binding protein n=1 Tax=Hyalangium versicolor TaxID=2861190 RepID=UPI001CCBE381|nr:NAD(P)H-binding protein [Hyalangium versicolor]